MGERHHHIRRSSRRVAEDHRVITLRGGNRRLDLDVFDHESPVHAYGRLEQRKGKPHTPGITQALYEAARDILQAIARKKNDAVHYKMETDMPRVKWFFQVGPGRNIFPWDKEDTSASGKLEKYATIRKKHSG